MRLLLVTLTTQWRFSGASERVAPTLARETRVNEANVAYTYNSSRGFGVYTRRLSDGVGEVVVAGQDVEPRSLIFTRYRAGWLQGNVAYLTSRIRNAGAPTVIRGSRDLPASTNAVADDGGTIVIYLDAEGVKTISPRIFF